MRRIGESASVALLFVGIYLQNKNRNRGLVVAIVASRSNRRGAGAGVAERLIPGTMDWTCTKTRGAASFLYGPISCEKTKEQAKRTVCRWIPVRGLELALRSVTDSTPGRRWGRQVQASILGLAENPRPAYPWRSAWRSEHEARKRVEESRRWTKLSMSKMDRAYLRESSSESLPRRGLLLQERGGRGRGPTMVGEQRLLNGSAAQRSS